MVPGARPIHLASAAAVGKAATVGPTRRPEGLAHPGLYPREVLPELSGRRHGGPPGGPLRVQRLELGVQGVHVPQLLLPEEARVRAPRPREGRPELRRRGAHALIRSSHSGAA